MAQRGSPWKGMGKGLEEQTCCDTFEKVFHRPLSACYQRAVDPEHSGCFEHDQLCSSTVLEGFHCGF